MDGPGTASTEGRPWRGRVLILPGRACAPLPPVLHYARHCASDTGWEVRVVRWGQDPPGPVHVRRAASDAAGPRAPSRVACGKLAVIAASVGSYAVPWAAQNRVPGVWIAPVLDDDEVIADLSRLPEGSLIVGGTADPAWDGAGAASSGLPVLQLEDADGELQVPGDVRRSLAALATVTSAVAQTLARIARERG